MSRSTTNILWNRLVRFRPKDDAGRILWGEPILENEQDDIAKVADEGKLRAQVLQGDNFVDAKASGQTEMVGQLLGPLSPRDVSSNLINHSSRNRAPPTTCLTIFTKPGPSVADYNEDIPIPVIAQEQSKYEGQLVVVIGKDAKNVKEEDALDYVGAYMVGNDVSASLVSPAILGAADDLELKALVNVEVRQQTNTSDLYLGVRNLIAFCS
ncbi:hypothetical protein CEP52_013828 [Fusarium oligoseptatum]|uniref:Fumarylacetoacetase-like C-terminal domain-containing protein n=2 Tax=Fusarium solani species complex TaxID=232080 RepID=A0A428SRK4_9HYPO|nr:hypothetical protein CEP51_014553 [Fusarium floridanum]RSL92412.1 hypothetical protein CEP52_013828 [Fusarium oligoseptatum]